MSREFVCPKARAEVVAAEFVRESVDGFYTNADNAIFALECYGLIAKAFTELISRNPQLAELLEEEAR